VARDLILKAHPSANVNLRKSGGGVFEVVVDGRLAYSKKAAGRFPTDSEIAACLS
jgi:selT/selW/selH-like putative selenoprotein